MATANYTYTPTTTVFVLVSPLGIRKGVVKVARVVDTDGTPVVEYDIQLAGETGVLTYPESALYNTVDAAFVVERERILAS
jgi:hypothetical protein